MRMVCRLWTLVLFFVFLIVVSTLSAEDLTLWQKRMPITFSGYEGTEPLINFPALIVLEETDAGAGFSYADFLSPPYGDLRFFADDMKTPLDFEVESWNIQGKSYVWVRIPELTKTTKIYALWGKAGVEEPDTPASSIWDSNYKCVWHLNENTLDTTVNENHSTNYNATTDSGLIGGAYDFHPDNFSYIDTPSNLIGYGILNAFTASCWCKTRQPSNKLQMLMEDGTGAGFDGIYLGIRDVTCYVQVYASRRANSDYLAVNPIGTNWHHIAVVYDGSSAKMYFDGEEKWDTTLSGNIKEANSRLHFGRRPDGVANFLDGMMDEIRVSTIARSADWIHACWKNQGLNESFVSYAPVENYGLPYITNVRGATNVMENSAWLNGFLVSTGFSETAVFVYWGTDDAGADAGAWDNFHSWTAPQSPKAFSHIISTLTPNTFYYYRFMAVNDAGTHWAVDTSVFFTGEVAFEEVSDAHFSGLIPGEIKVYRGAADTEPLDVFYSIGGTAIPGVDYTELPGIVTIPAGETSVTIIIQPLPAKVMPETKTVELEVFSGCIKGTPSIAETKILVENLTTWRKRMKIDFRGYTQQEILTNFPALIILKETSGFSHTDFLSDNYGDLRFAAEDKLTPLDFEVEAWDLEGKSYVWVRVPELTSSTIVYALWGKEDAVAPTCTTNGSVWVANFTGVWHLSEDSGITAYDSLANMHPGTIMCSTVTLGTSGKIANADEFSGKRGHVRTEPVHDTTVTISAWGSFTSNADGILWS
ncbi:MAG: DUF2341 domain-containing protein, partial [Lentisphaerae bacterium]|nr:DUF2341 domain-containing protein [Lentisphaerota bacterium]